MYLILLHYTKPIEQVDAARGPHLEWIAKYSKEGTFLLAGRQTSGKGGCIIAQTPTRDALDAILQEDNYIKADVARHEVIEVDFRSGALADAALQASAR
jgi:uncharacterized protein YciI